jgi:hypothetical protein
MYGKWLFFFSFFETKGRHVNAKAQEAVDHLASIPSSREERSFYKRELNRQSLP